MFSTSKLFIFIMKRYGHCLFLEYEIQGVTNRRDSFCATFCLFMNHLTKVTEKDFDSAVLNLFYQRCS